MARKEEGGQTISLTLRSENSFIIQLPKAGGGSRISLFLGLQADPPVPCDLHPG